MECCHQHLKEAVKVKKVKVCGFAVYPSLYQGMNFKHHSDSDRHDYTSGQDYQTRSDSLICSGSKTSGIYFQS